MRAVSSSLLMVSMRVTSLASRVNLPAALYSVSRNFLVVTERSEITPMRVEL